MEDKAKIQNEIKEKDKIISEKDQNIEELKEKIKKLKKIIKIYWFMLKK